MNTLARGLGIQYLETSQQTFPEDFISAEKMLEFLKGNTISQSHIHASQLNFEFIETLLDKWIFHIRDPRQSLISWLHHLETYIGETNADDPCNSKIPKLIPLKVLRKKYMDQNWFSLDMEKKLDIMINSYYMDNIKWMGAWFDLLPSFKNARVLITRHENMVKNEKLFFETILDFLEISQDQFNAPTLSKDRSVHFRSGRTNEWQEVLTKKQQEQVTAMMPQEWRSRFGWV
jgi:hypothetical protein